MIFQYNIHYNFLNSIKLNKYNDNSANLLKSFDNQMN
jgi:hypothetical protein